MEAQILFRRQVLIKSRVLKDHADSFSHLVAVFQYIVTIDRCPTSGGPEEGAEHVDSGRLASPVWAEKAKNLAPSYPEGNPVNRGKLTEIL